MIKFTKIAVLALVLLVADSSFALNELPESLSASIQQSKSLENAPVKKGSHNVYGSNLFNGVASNPRQIDPNPDYKLAPGDKLDVKTWGAVNRQQVSTVDSEGNIFLPEIGPVKMEGVKQSEINSVISESVGNVYKDNVEVYANLLGNKNISVFVSGGVIKPGRYMGDSRFSIIDYINSAGGIDTERGSFRDIQVIRENKKILDVDLYDFLQNGIMPAITLSEGDTILVNKRGSLVDVEGNVDSPFKFEFKLGYPVFGSDIASVSNPKTDTTNVILSGIRNGRPYSVTKDLAAFYNTSVMDGDKVSFISNLHNDKIRISVSGLHTGAKAMVVPIDAKLSEVLDNISVNPQLSDTGSIYLRRKSVAAAQKKAIKESLNNLQETILLAKASGDTTSSAGETPVSATDLKVIEALIQKAIDVEPEGRLVFSSSTDFRNISLEEGDEIVIPQKTEVVTINGEVLVPQAIIYDEDFSVSDYINKSGGFSDRANEDKVLVVHANGETEIGRGTTVKPGDEIMVLPEIKFNNLEVAGKVFDIIYKVAVAAAVPLSL